MKMELPYRVLATLLGLAIFPLSCSQGSPTCRDDDGCGWNSFCEGGRCGCIPGHTWSKNKRDCIDVRCQDARCLECTEPDKCRRCVDFIEAGTGRCLDGCHNSYMLVIEGAYVGRVCPVSAKNDMLRVYVAIVIGVGFGIFLTGIAVLCFCWKSKDNGLKKQKPRPPSRLEIEKVQSSGLVNKAFENIYTQNGTLPNGTASLNGAPNGKVLNGVMPKRPNEPPPPPKLQMFTDLVRELRPQLDTFLSMLKEVKIRNRGLQNGDSRSYVYKNVIHQLIRVLTLLNSETEEQDVPSDGVLLLRWAQSLLQKYLAINDPEYWEPGSPVGTLTSTFKPDHKLVPHGVAPGIHHSNNSFKYERYDPDELDDISEDYKSLSIQLDHDFTEPIEV